MTMSIRQTLSYKNCTFALGMALVSLFSCYPASAQWTTNSSTATTTTTDKVGISTTTPVSQLNVASTATVGAGSGGAGVSIANLTLSATQASSLNIQSYGNNNSWIGWSQYFNGSQWIATAPYAFKIYDYNNYLGFYADSTSAGPFTPSARMVILPSGNVGIGTTSPGDKLEVYGNIRFTDNIIESLLKRADGVNNLIKTSRSDDTQVGKFRTNGWGDFTVDRSFAVGYDLSGTGYGTGSLFAATALGVGTTAPTSWGAFAVRTSAALNGKNVSASLSDGVHSTFDIRHPANNVVDLSAENSALTFSTVTGSSTDGTERMRIDTSGKVGIGTPSPVSKFDVSDGTTHLYLEPRSGSGNFNQGTDVASWGHTLNLAGGIVDGNPSSGVNINFYNGAVWQRALQVKNNATGSLLLMPDQGRVGIGTASPGYTLDVNGTINSNNTITANNIVAKYQDVAEWVPASEQLSAGTVVVLNATKSNQVTSSTVSYDTRVAGVVSEHPGIALGEKGDGKVLVATTGRVRVKVDATNGPIHVGDLLVTSGVPGVAMKSKPVNLGGVRLHRPGTLIGKALEPLEKGKGSILVLLSLQ